MQKVSNEYKQSMKTLLRERGFIKISFGLVNQEAQANASVADGDEIYYSNNKHLLEDHGEDSIYATLEEDFTKVDGTMLIPPRPSQVSSSVDTGLVSRLLVSDSPYEMVINLNTLPMDFKGLTIDFGEDYPVDFDIIGDTNTVEYRGNDDAVFVTEDVFYQTTRLRFVFYTMKNTESRLRVYSIRFGYGLVYGNSSVIESKLETYISPICADVPQIDFYVILKNYDKYFNVDNPNSAINYLETGQEMDISYGYQLPDSDKIEWIKGQHLLCSEWESDDTQAIIKCQDVFRNMDIEYYKGLYAQNGKSYFALATEILTDAGYSAGEYYLDPRLKDLYTKNPMPREKHKIGLQLIANACRCTLGQSREGRIEIKSNFVPEGTASANAETAFSNVESIMDYDEKDEYSTMANDYTIVAEGMYVLGKTASPTKNTGFISAAVSDENCEFSTNPVVTVSLLAVRTYGSLEFDFGHALPGEFILHTYNNGTPVDDFVVGADEISKKTVVIRNFDDFNVIEIEFTKTQVPHSRIVFNHFGRSEVMDFTMERRDMTCSPKAIKQELIKSVVVPCYLYQPGDREYNLIYEDVDVTSGEEAIYYVQHPAYNFSVKIDDQAGGAQITAWGNYYIKVKFLVSGEHKLGIYGYQYRIVEKKYVKELHTRGKTITWRNPLISDYEMAKDLAEWLADYYQSGVEYEYTTRGNPELDATDIIYQENEFHSGMKVNIFRHIVKFRQAFSGFIAARRVGG